MVARGRSQSVIVSPGQDSDSQVKVREYDDTEETSSEKEERR